MGATVFFESSSEIATLRNVFKVAGTPTDPATISLTVTTPAQVSTTYTYTAAQITRNGAGDYQKDITCNEDGEWSYLWEGTGAASDAEPGTWTVYPTDLGKLYATPAALKSRLGNTETAADYEFHAACFSASRWIEQYCERHFYRTPTGTVRTFEPNSAYLLRLPEFNDLVSIGTLKTDAAGDGTFETTWATSDYQAHPVNPSAAPEPHPYTKIKAVGSKTFPLPYEGCGTRDDRVEITGIFGWPSVPWAIRQATLILAADTFALRGVSHGILGVAEFGAIRIRENAAVLRFAGPYRRHSMLAA
jgi:hypothetical protein